MAVPRGMVIPTAAIKAVTAWMEAPRLSRATSDIITPQWMALGAVVAGRDMRATKAMSNWVARVPRVVSLARQCIMPVVAALPRATARAGAPGYNLGGGGSGPAVCLGHVVFRSCQYGRRRWRRLGRRRWCRRLGRGHRGLRQRRRRPTRSALIATAVRRSPARAWPTAARPPNRPAPTKTGYTFVRWCADSGLTTAFDFATPSRPTPRCMPSGRPSPRR